MEKYEQVNVQGYEEFCRAVAERAGKEIFVYFSGDKDEQGMSWCPDCVQAHGNQKSSISNYWNISFSQCRNVQLPAEPVVRKEMVFLPEGSVFIYCQVGDRPYWKDPSNDFKKTLKLTGVPTLIRYGTPQKLVEEQCFKPELVRMMFTED